MFEHRLGALLGLSIADVLALPERELDRWRAYWLEEPWGAHRDNMHAALICQQIIRMNVKRGTVLPPIVEFMFKPAPDIKANAAEAFVAKLDMLSRRKPK